MGNAKFRVKFWMFILTVVRKNAWLKVFYDRFIVNGKFPKVVLMVVMRKFFVVVYSVVKNRKFFVFWLLSLMVVS
jgi:hypothetical protein